RAERMHRELFRPAGAIAQLPSWEPPVDILETDDEVLIIAALPGVSASQIEAAIDGSCLVIAGDRTLPQALAVAVIHRIELPQGRFERRVPLPPGRYGAVKRTMIDGCLVVSLQKVG
ncbi:MAG TPA: Hsp20/alpha crystallin family protein, partial [Caulobacteraceae bacterium]|nr:Hsp20/alpha crystallin family protein [Caulobacteraceae bacterium]